MTFIETTHVGSLPRGDALTPLLLARDHGEPYDADAFDRVVQEAVDEGVRKQVEADARGSERPVGEAGGTPAPRHPSGVDQADGDEGRTIEGVVDRVDEPVVLVTEVGRALGQ